MLQSTHTSTEPPIPCFYYPYDNSAKYMIYFHGIGEDIGRITRELDCFRMHLKVNVLAVEYPGYGINFYKGVCSEQQMKKDSYSVLDFLLSTGLKMSELLVFGRSIGTGVATNLAY